MKTKIFMLMIACLLTNAIAQAQVFVIERGASTSLTFDNIKSAVDALQDNDCLYIPPGVFSLTGYTWTGYNGTINSTNTLCVNKKVSIFGAGYNSGNNSTIITGGNLVLGKNAGGSLITGINFNNSSNLSLSDVSNCIVSRCKFGSGGIQLCGIGNNINISECEIANIFYNSGLDTSSASNMPASFSKCIFSTTIGYYNFQFASVSNSLFLQMGTLYITNSSFSNNIFIVSNTTTNTNYNMNYLSTSNNTFTNNLWVGGYPSSGASYNNTFTNEIIKETYANAFVDPANGNYHLKDVCIGKNAGSDGTDVGIFGTVMPFKESRLPSVPYFKTKVISPETDAAGKLPVYIQIEAQDR